MFEMNEAGQQSVNVDPRPWKIHRDRRGNIRWYQRLLEAAWIVSGRWSLHRAWSEGYTRHIQDESARRARTFSYESACVAASPILRNALSSIAANGCCDRCQEAALVARQALAKTDQYFRPPGTGPIGRIAQPEVTGSSLGTPSGAGSIVGGILYGAGARPEWPAPGCWGRDKP